MNKCQKIVFGVSFALILVVICVCVVLYRMVFNGGLSTDSNDWIAFATLVGSIGTMLFTGLNVIVFYMLTSAIAQRDSTYKKREQQITIVNRFHSNILCIFTPDESGNPSCEVNAKLFLRAIDWFEKIKKHKSLLPILGSKDYVDFVDEFRTFCGKYTIDCGDERIVFDGHYAEEVAYRLYLKARDISFKMLDDIVPLP